MIVPSPVIGINDSDSSYAIYADAVIWILLTLLVHVDVDVHV